MIPSWARVGAKVICVDDGPTRASPPTGMYWANDKLLIAGSTYTVRWTGFHAWTGEFSVKLLEVTRPIYEKDETEQPYGIWRFRPLVTEADDIDLFKSLLNPTLVDKLDLLAERLDHIYNE